MNKPTIFSANDNSKVVINQANSRKRNRKKRDEDGGDPTTNVSCEIDTNYTAKFMINNVDFISPWNQYKIHCQNHLSCGSSTVETDTAKLLSQAHIMLLKRDAVDSDLKEMLGSGVVEEINNKVKECFGIEDEELPQETERGLKDVIKDTIDEKNQLERSLIKDNAFLLRENEYSPR
ncbi:hypothetical protein G6F56_007289 [Rhizopus delemar]|nr:hypothetical protein G6F56_007289 [Rhizopus delemar]